VIDWVLYIGDVVICICHMFGVVLIEFVIGVSFKGGGGENREDVMSVTVIVSV